MPSRRLVVVPALLVVAVAAVAVPHDRTGPTEAPTVKLVSLPPVEPVRAPQVVVATTTTTTTTPPVLEPPPPPPPPPPPVPPPPPPPPSPPPPSPPPPPPPPAPAPSGAVAEVLAMHNAERAARGLAPLALSGCLSGVAQGWSEHLAATHQLGHNPAGLSRSMGCTGGGSVGENVGYATTLGTIHTMWMASGGHAANVLGANYRYVGIGVAGSADGYLWVTVDFSA